MMTVLLTCPTCSSAIHVYPNINHEKVQCDICHGIVKVKFDQDHVDGIVKQCPCCKGKDFYIQKDFNRKVGVLLFIVASVAAIFTYGMSFIILYLLDFFLFQKLNYIVVCYKCSTIFRKANNWSEIGVFDHEKNDRIIYSGHSFQS